MNKKGKKCKVHGVWYISIRAACESTGARLKSILYYHEKHPKWTIEKCIDKSLSNNKPTFVYVNDPFTGEPLGATTLARKYHVSGRNLRDDFLAGIPITKEYFKRKTSRPELRIKTWLEEVFGMKEEKNYRHDVWLTSVFNEVPKECVGLRIDFVVMRVNGFEKVAIEVDGEQHIYPKMRGHTSYIQGVANDVLKENYFYSHKIPLLRISSKETTDKEKVIEKMRDFLEKPRKYILDRKHNSSKYHAVRNKVLAHHGVDIKEIEQKPVLFKNKDFIRSTHLKPTIDPFSNVSYSTLRYLCDSWEVNYKVIHQRIKYRNMTPQYALAKSLIEKEDDELERLAKKHKMRCKDLIKMLNEAKVKQRRKGNPARKNQTWTDKKGVEYVGLHNIANTIGCSYNTFRTLVSPSGRNLSVNDAVVYAREHGLTSNL